MRVLLTSCRGATDLGTIEANHIVLLDPAKKISRTYELLAMGRAQPHGQDRKLYLVRFNVRNTIEDFL